MASSDLDLVRAVRSGDASAAAALFDRHWPAMWRLALAYTGQRELADEAAQDGFVRALDALARFDERRSFLPWLRAIVVNAALDAGRREHRHARGSVALDDELDERLAEADDDDVDAVRAALRRLAPDRRAVLVLRFWFDYELAHIAEALDVPVGTVSSRLARGLADLRIQLETIAHE